MVRGAPLITMDSVASCEPVELQRFARLAAPLLQGAIARRPGPHAARSRPGQGLEYLDLRHYQQGDDVRHIDWRQSARRGRTVVRRFRDEGSADWFLCVDSSASVKLHAGKWAMQVQLASALGFALLSAGHRMGLLLFSDRVAGCLPLGRGAQQHTRLLSLLNESGAPRQSVPGKSTSRYERGSSLGQCRDFMEKQCHVFVISDLLEPAGMREDLRALRASSSGVHALQVLSPDEVSIAARGSARLHDIESGRAEVVTLSDDAIARAGARLAEHQAGLARDCAALGVRFAACATTDRWERVLLAHLAAPG